MERLTHDEFFTKLTELFNSKKNKDHGAIYLSQRRLTYNQPDAPQPTKDDPLADLRPPERPLPVLVRASNGKSAPRRAEKIRLTTVVEADALDAFYARYAEVCKAGMTGLKPRDRTKRRAKAKKKKSAA